jgi:hypothetical protein
MNDATVRFGYDGAALNAGLRDAETRISRSAGKMEQSLVKVGKKGGGGFRNLGLMSQQVQDVAVQMQMGTRMSTIIAQQGSQILSIFGPGGMILGGIVAVGGALYSAQQAGEQAFQQLQRESSDFDKTLRGLSAGGIAEMINGMEDMQKRAAELRKEIAAASENTTWNNLTNPIAKFFSKSTFDESTGEWMNRQEEETATKAELARKAEQGRLQLIDQIITASDEELTILKLKAANQDEAAMNLEHEVKLRRELAKIEAAPEEIRDRLRKNAVESAAAELSIAKAKTNQSASELQNKRELIELSRAEVGMLEMQVKGQDKKLKKAQEQAFITKRAQEFSKQGLDANASIALAKREWNAREAIANKQSGGRSHIGGVGNKRYMSTGGIDEFNRMQLDREYGIDERTPAGMRGGYRGKDGHFYGGYGREFGSLSERDGMGRGRMMGQTDQGSISSRSARSTTNPDLSRAATPASGGDVGTKLDKTNNLLERVFFAAS